MNCTMYNRVDYYLGLRLIVIIVWIRYESKSWFPLFIRQFASLVFFNANKSFFFPLSNGFNISDSRAFFSNLTIFLANISRYWSHVFIDLFNEPQITLVWGGGKVFKKIYIYHYMEANFWEFLLNSDIAPFYSFLIV